MAWPGWEGFTPQHTTEEQPRRSKYRSKPTAIDGIRFASKHEAARYTALKLEERAGRIRDLVLQRAFPLNVVTPGGQRVAIGSYVADFSYLRNGAEVVEDAKGMRTPLYTWKRKHVEAQYGIRIVEV